MDRLMFMLYAVLFGLLVGIAIGGRIDGLTEVRFRWAGLALAGLAVQLLLFSTPLTALIGDNGAPFYVGSSAAVFAVVLRNWRIAGLPIVALGAASNLAAIVSNGGWMPASRDGLAGLGTTITTDYSNSREFTAPALGQLTDVFALPRWVPFANVFSIGDVLIGAGVFVAIVVAMHRRRASDPGPGGATSSDSGVLTARPEPRGAGSH
jgi:Family of unknown function (DUF5317)